MRGVPQFSCFNSVLDTEYVASAWLSPTPGAQPQADPCWGRAAELGAPGPAQAPCLNLELVGCFCCEDHGRKCGEVEVTWRSIPSTLGVGSPSITRGTVSWL